MIFAIGSLLLGIGNNIEEILLGRLLVGIAAAFSTVSAVPYLKEIGPFRYNGRFSSIYEVMFVFGILIANVVNLAVYKRANSWRHVFLLPILFGAIQSWCMYYIPESPSWLIQKGFVEKATKALEQIYNDPEIINDELTSLKLANITKNKGTFQTVVYLLTQYKPALIVVIIISIFDGLCGGSVFYSYFPSMLQQYTTIPTIITLQYNVYLAIIRVCTTCYAVSRLDSVNGGRRLLLLRGISLIIIGQLCMCTMFYQDCNSNTASKHCWKQINNVFIISSGLVVIGQAIGFSIVLHLLQTEMFPTIIRSRAMGISMIVQNISLFMINITFLPLIDRYNIQRIFLCYSICAIIGIIIIYYTLPETRNMRPLDILQLIIHNDIHNANDILNKKGGAVVINRSKHTSSTSNPILIHNPLVTGMSHNTPPPHNTILSGSPLPVITLYPHIISPSNNNTYLTSIQSTTDNNTNNTNATDSRLQSADSENSDNTNYYTNTVNTSTSNFVMNIAYRDTDRSSISY